MTNSRAFRYGQNVAELSERFELRYPATGLVKGKYVFLAGVAAFCLLIGGLGVVGSFDSGPPVATHVAAVPPPAPLTAAQEAAATPFIHSYPTSWQQDFYCVGLTHYVVKDYENMAVGMPTVQDYFADAEQFAVKWQARGNIGWKDAHRGTEQEMLADTSPVKAIEAGMIAARDWRAADEPATLGKLMHGPAMAEITRCVHREIE